MIKLTRKCLYYRDKARSYKIMIDGKCYGKIKDGETKNIDIGSGHHTMYLKIDWCRSNKIDFHISDNEILEFECANSMNNWRMLFYLLYFTFLKNKYLTLKKIT